MCSYFFIAGLNPVPASLNSSFRDSAVNKSSGWWEHVQPAEGSYEEQWHRVPCSGPEAAGMPADWTVYDAKKLHLGLKIVSHAAVLLRLVSSPQCVRSPRDLQAVNANAAAEAFCKCAGLSLQLRASALNNGTSSTGVSSSYDGFAGAAGDKVLERAARLVDMPLGGPSSVDWLRSPLAVSAPFSRFAPETPLSPVPKNASGTAVGGFQVVDASNPDDAAAENAGRLAVAESLLVIAENLVCVVHSLAQLQTSSAGSSSSNSRSGAVLGSTGLSTEATLRTLDAADAYPPHSFIRQVARWVKDLSHH